MGLANMDDDAPLVGPEVKRRLAEMEQERRIVLTKASEIRPEPDVVTLPGWVVVEVIRSVLPEGWEVLPDGRSTAKAIRRALGDRMDAGA